jgi:hypothetical protein
MIPVRSTSTGIVKMASLRNRRIGNNGHSFGTAAIYWARSEFWTYGQGDYEIQLGAKSFPKEMRAYRQRAKERGKKYALRDEALEDQVVVVFGPSISPEQAMNLLRQLANKIGKRGLYTGDNQHGQATFERKVIQI